MQPGTNAQDEAGLSPQSLEHAWHESVLRTQDQALDDLARTGASEVVFLRQPKATGAWEFLDPFEEICHQAGFVTSRVAVLGDNAFDSFDGLVRAVGRGLRAPGANEKSRGIIAALDLFIRRQGNASAALDTFNRGVADHHATGDLIELARAYLEQNRRPTREAARIEAWLAGTELVRADADPVALSALSPRTAKRSLGEITRLLRALGFRGTCVIFTSVEVLTRLPAGRREDAYTVLRELIDNADGGRGLVAMQVVLSGTHILFDGARGLTTLPPLAMRVLSPPDADALEPPPHRPLVDLAVPPAWVPPAKWPSVRPAATGSEPSLRALIRTAQGLPPTEPVASMSVGHERIDETITALFEHAEMQSSVFALLTGAYGTGKSHLLLHLAARALANKRPVFRLSLERLDADLGNPQRHIRRLLEHAMLPLPDRPGPLDRLVAWTRSSLQLRRLMKALDEVAAQDGDSALPARKALGLARKSKHPGLALEGYLNATELLGKSSNPNYRQDAYQRLHLWIALLAKLEGCEGPVVLIDEAENLYRAGTTRAERRTALRSLSFYCGGTLPGACVVMAITPDALGQLRAEATELLEDVAEQKTVLAWEDAAMLRHRLTALRPIEVPALTSAHRIVLAYRVQATHEKVRGPVKDTSWARYVSDVTSLDIPPRELMRRLADRLERTWWWSDAIPQELPRHTLLEGFAPPTARTSHVRRTE